MRCHRREKVFGPGRAVPLDRNAKAPVERVRGGERPRLDGAVDRPLTCPPFNVPLSRSETHP
jgi:hypothetical protein